MAYCAKADVSPKLIDGETLVQLTDDYDTGIADDAVITEAIADADAEIDGYCARRYDVPFSPVPRIITKLSIDLTIYNLYDRRLGAPEHIEKRRDNAIKLLGNIAKGLVSLGADEPESTADCGITVDAPTQIFTHTRFEEY